VRAGARPEALALVETIGPPYCAHSARAVACAVTRSASVLRPPVR
jgi:hypothetical protein